MTQCSQLTVQPMPWQEPEAAFACIAHKTAAVFLDSAAGDDARSRWSVIAVDPARFLSGDVGGQLRLNGENCDLTLGDAIRQLMPERTAAPETLPCGIPLPGVFGYLGFEAGGLCDVMPLPRGPRLLPDVWLGFYRTIAVFDVVARQAWVLSLDGGADALKNTLQSAPPDPCAPEIAGYWHEDAHAEAYPRMVQQIVDYIAAGDVFQVNATWCFEGEKPGSLDAYTIYKRLRRLSPAPFAAFVRVDDERALVSASPELFLRVSAQGGVETRPIKGTRPRGHDAISDAALARELAASPKDRAENLMIVDLMRNDLGRVCAVGSVGVPRLWEVEHFHNVHHLVSEVRGTLAAGRDAIDLLCACLPPGSVTGAPKIRCLDIIREREPVPRGAYCGVLLHWGCGGAFNSSVLIRTMSVAGGRVTAQAGGGIVFDSSPEDELAEMLLKAKAMRQALTGHEY
jgi:para-aminobenzoate synthetase component 1